MHFPPIQFTVKEHTKVIELLEVSFQGTLKLPWALKAPRGSWHQHFSFWRGQ